MADEWAERDYGEGALVVPMIHQLQAVTTEGGSV